MKSGKRGSCSCVRYDQHMEQRDRDRPFFQSQKQRTERHGDEGPRHGAASRKVSSESAVQVVVSYCTGAGPATTT